MDVAGGEKFSTKSQDDFWESEVFIRNENRSRPLRQRKVSSHSDRSGFSNRTHFVALFASSTNVTTAVLSESHTALPTCMTLGLGAKISVGVVFKFVIEYSSWTSSGFLFRTASCESRRQVMRLSPWCPQSSNNRFLASRLADHVFFSHLIDISSEQIVEEDKVPHSDCTFCTLNRR